MTEENPYRAPFVADGPEAVGVRGGKRENLRNVAKYQKGIIICILIYFVMVFTQFAIPEELQIVMALGVLAVGITSMVFVFLLAVNVYSTAAGVFLGILTLVPCLGLIVLLIINSKATGILRKNKIHVGLLGADLSKI